MASISFRATAARPCEVCRSGSKGCSAWDNGTHLCRGIPAHLPAPNGWLELLNGPDKNGFRHFRRVDDPPSARPAARGNPTSPPRNWPAEAEKYAADISPEAKAELARKLCQPVGSLDALPLIGTTGRDKDGWTFTFPEFDAAGNVIGITRRFPDGSKKMIQGGKRGLTIPAGWRDRAGAVFIVEGASDVLAMTLCGLSCIGRPNNAGGAELLADLLRDVGREIVVVGENDRKPNGDCPGRDGAEAVAGKLADRLGKPIRIAFPPEGSKDVRNWLTADTQAAMTWAERGEILRKAMLESEQVIEPPASSGSSKDEQKHKTPAAETLIILARQNADLFHDAGKVAYATIGSKTHKIHSSLFRSWLTNLYYKHTNGRAPNNEAFSVAIKTLEALAVNEAPERAVHVRLTEQSGCIYLNLADEAGTVIRIGPEGWAVDPEPPIRFLATTNSAPLPIPVKGGTIADLRRFVNCPDDDAFALLCGWISASFRGDIPFPLLVLTGEAGSAKSTTGRFLKELIDPEIVEDRSAPRELEDLAIWAARSWILNVDNISGFPDWLSDGFCRLAYGSGFGTRTKYTNDEETVFKSKRPVILNGIEDFITRGDLLERSIILRHPPIPESRRRLESELRREFNEAKPKLLGAILDRVAAGLKALPDVDTSRMPRMADAVAFAVACENGMHETVRFLEAFRQNQAESLEMQLEDSPIVEPVRKLVSDAGGTWVGTASELLAATKPADNKPSPRWPKKPSGLSGMLRRLAPALAKCLGLTVSHERTTDTKRTRIIRLTLAPENRRNSSSRASDLSETNSPTSNERTATDGPDDSFREFSGTKSQPDTSAIFR
jgi:hypothetical protein